MKKLISKIIFSLLGWEIITSSYFPEKCIIVAAPHTSNWDFLFGRCFSYIVDIKPKYLAKSQLFIPVLGYLLKLNGGVPVYRDSKNDIVQQMVSLFQKHKKFILGIAPEGTRSKVEKWKTGFYYIALEAKVPIILTGIDYKKKVIGVIGKLIPTGDFNKDMKYIQDKFQYLYPKNPQNYNINIF
ncbi:MAG: 1-acyl-sn-glycerol-3-phosphate acyltransferase [Bacteroidota bacterium]|nr:1-acyl-sn-glycerol-3-phosphate acyltransferase [Bacteroidota bacterium]